LKPYFRLNTKVEQLNNCYFVELNRTTLSK